MATIAEALSAAVAHHQAGRLTEAEALYRRILQVDPNQPDALHLLGLVARQAGRLDLAVELIGKAVALRPDMVEAHLNLGNVLKAAGRGGLAEASYRRALELRPSHVDAAFNLAVLLHTSGRREEAVPLYREVLAGRPDHVDALYNLGVAFQGLNRLDEAVATYRAVTARKPDHAGAHNNLSATLRHQAKFDEAIAAAERALALDPDYAEAHKNLSFCLLIKGDYAAGFRHYEWRKQAVDGRVTEVPRPEWDGGPLAGRTILLQSEQGLGDTLQFIRFAPLLRARGARVVLNCPAPLRRLMQGVEGVDQLVGPGEPVPAVDCWAPLASLPLHLGITLDTLPARVPYIVPDPELVAAWRARLGPRGGVRRVGLVWAGNPDFPGDKVRSRTLSSVRPLLEVPGIRVYGLQKGAGRRDLEGFAAPPHFTDLGAGIDDFADTAAVVANLDLVISTCTSMVHLCGAIGRPFWVMLPFVPDWRWLLEREDSPWYPTARLFRQDDPDDPQAVVARVQAALGVWAAGSDAV